MTRGQSEHAFLITDVEGSTALWERFGETMARAIERFHAIGREAVASAGGRIFATGGDSQVVVFDDPVDAVVAAMAARAALEAEPWTEGCVIRVRMGIHVGPAIEQDGDFFGPTVNLTARISDAGHGGQVLLSAAAAAATPQESRPLGRFRFKGIEEPVVVHQIGDVEFPALRDAQALSRPRVDLLGPVRAVVDGEEVALGTPKERTVLVSLALAAGRPVSIDELIDRLWPTRPPVRAKHSVQQYVSRLRGRLEPARGKGAARRVLRNSHGGYVLDVDTDLAAFRSAVEEARSALVGNRDAEALDLLRAAEALWRGPSIADLRGEPWVDGETVPLDDSRLAVVELRTGVQLRLGAVDGLVPELEALVTAHPFRERLWALLIRALHRDSRRADALDAFERARQVLADQLGLDPGEELAAAQREVLIGDSPMAAPRPDQPDPSARPQGSGNRGLPSRRRTSFIGRGEDVDAVLADLEQQRLVSLHGPGGVGKTRVAEQVVAVLARRGTDVAWVDLATVDDPAGVASAFAQSVSAPLPPGAPTIEALTDHLRERAMTVIVDNCEHVVLDAAAVIDEVSAACPGVTILATTREVLGLEGEVVRRLNRLPAVDAEALFRDRAALADPGGSDPDPAVVATICRRLDGIPLALELAASRLRMLSARQLASALDDRFALLSGGARTDLPRQQTLEASIAWSYDLLDPGQQRTLEALSVFAAPFSIEAAVEVLGGLMGDAHVPVALFDLIDRSLVSPVTAGDEAVRYRLLESIRAFAAAKLASRPELREAVVEAHLARYRRLAYYTQFLMHREGWQDHTALLDQEFPEIRAAISHARRTDRETVALELIAGCGTYLMRRTAVHDLSGLIAGAIRDEPVATVAEARAVTRLAVLMLWYADPDSGARLARRVAGRPVIPRAEAAWACCRGVLDLVDAERGLRGSDHEQEAMAVARRSANPGAVSSAALFYLGTRALCGTPQQVIEIGEPLARDGASHFGEAVHLTYTCMMLGWAHVRMGRLDVGEGWVREDWDALVAVGDHPQTYQAMILRALVAGLRGRDDEAIEWHSAARALHETDPVGRVWSRRSGARWGVIETARLSGLSEAAARVVFEDPTDRTLPVARSTITALTALDAGHAEDAIAAADAATAAGAEGGHSWACSQAAVVHAQVHACAGTPGADEVMAAALSRLGQTDRVLLPDVVDAVATLSAHRGQEEHAARLLAAARVLRSSMGTARWRIDRDRMDRVAAGIGDELGADAIAGTAAEVSDMTHEDVVALAMGALAR